MAAAFSAYKEKTMRRSFKVIISILLFLVAAVVCVLKVMDFSIIPQTEYVYTELVEVDGEKIVLEVKNETSEEYYYTDYFWITKYNEKLEDQVLLEYKNGIKPDFTNEAELIYPGENKIITIYYSEIYESLSDGVYDFENFGFIYDENGEKIVWNLKERFEISGDISVIDSEIDSDLAYVNVLKSTDRYVEIEIINNSDMMLFYGEPYHIESLELGGWSELPEKEKSFFTMAAYGIMPGKSENWFAEFEWRYGSLPKGTYRVVKDISFENDMDEGYTDLRIYAQFSVE